MSLGPDYLQYPRRRHGMDHDRYAWSMLAERAPVAWPDGKPLALWLNLSLEHFPLNPAGEGFKAPGSMTMPYPDLRHYTLRDYGNRVGVFRVLDALKQHNLTASVAVNGELAERYPALLRRVQATGFELLGHGWNMDCVHYGGLDETREREWIQRSVAALQPYAAQPIRGWLSPARSQSHRTPDLLREAGIGWCADWVNDELPYAFNTDHGPLSILPLSLELEDRFIVGDNLHSESQYADQAIDACEFLLAEARETGHGRMLALNIHPWVMGQPHRIKHLERVFAHLASRADSIWNAAPSAILAAAAPNATEAANASHAS
ncbi:MULTISPECIES: polysaccharide deacetylase family protein [Lysobacteraceae]|uniref:Polysaccharide deacetylase family protein n=1 Tax=Novilysobacter avium TaxID=2781023 RepID=A0A7S6UKN5_9GAMM|nr:MULTISPECIES: polysaccharide deacetylase family protein [Lysobacter]QOW21984.1 polysaccharide deacetylase family protein [Lysobacter avium]QOW24454.1 polysaccharide deacetylase family protein [Lysobacter sp. H23M47]